jgi:hypothetical protein
MMDYESTLLRKHQFYALQTISMEEFNSLRVDHLEPIRSMCKDELEFRVRSFVYGTDKEEEKVTYPKDWWQAFKERWFSRWMLKRWPVRYITVKMSKYAVYPTLPVQPGGKLEYHICIPKLEKDQWEWDNPEDC